MCSVSMKTSPSCQGINQKKPDPYGTFATCDLLLTLVGGGSRAYRALAPAAEGGKLEAKVTCCSRYTPTPFHSPLPALYCCRIPSRVHSPSGIT